MVVQANSQAGAWPQEMRGTSVLRLTSFILRALNDGLLILRNLFHLSPSESRTWINLESTTKGFSCNHRKLIQDRTLHGNRINFFFFLFLSFFFFFFFFFVQGTGDAKLQSLPFWNEIYWSPWWEFVWQAPNQKPQRLACIPQNT